MERTQRGTGSRKAIPNGANRCTGMAIGEGLLAQWRRIVRLRVEFSGSVLVRCGLFEDGGPLRSSLRNDDVGRRERQNNGSAVDSIQEIVYCREEKEGSEFGYPCSATTKGTTRIELRCPISPSISLRLFRPNSTSRPPLAGNPLLVSPRATGIYSYFPSSASLEIASVGEEIMEERRTEVMQRFHSSSAATATATATAAAASSPPSYSPSFIPRPPGPLDLPNFGPPFRQFTPDSVAAKRPGIPPIPPSPTSSSTAAFPFHSRSLSQPLAFDSLPHLSPSPAPPPPLLVDPMMIDDRKPSSRTPTSRDGLPPRRSHRRSHSDVPYGLPLPSPPAPRPMSSSKQVESSDAEDDLIFAYMDNLDTLNSSGTEDRQEDLVECSRLSGTRTSGADSSENEAESSVNESGGDGRRGRVRKEGNKRSAAADLTPTNSRHRRSISVDSFMGKLHFGDDTPKFPPSPGNQIGQLSRSGSMDETMNTFSLELGNDEFNAAEVKKIMADEKLAEMALADPKKVKRILANRLSAARSKERKMRYMSELEHKVQILQTEATTLSAQLTMLQRDSAGLTNQNNELKFRLQAMEQQAHLKDGNYLFISHLTLTIMHYLALNEQLSAEVQRLKLATGEISEAQLSKNMNQQMQLSPQMFQLHQLQSQQHSQQKQQIAQAPLCQQPQPQQQRAQNNGPTKLESSRC
ncbi:hypothetical protein ZIOFF_038151 [Zingiber officinale]|uniref:BZIP domain-containing protein n=1 Tax=Zingiber officinale TaxID=94328 RepID=A0A8J5GG13_ZINOF|nr:hypothetical protein ZIOFF_038151 [Zingiber officinale]